MTIWRVCIACWIHKATASHPEYVILITFHCKNRYANAPQCCFYACISPLVLLSSLLGCICPYMTLFYGIWHIWLFVRIWPYLTVFDLFDCIWPYLYWLYLTVFYHIWPYLTVFDLFDCICPYMTLFDGIWPIWLYLTVFDCICIGCIWLNLKFFEVKRCGTYSNH